MIFQPYPRNHILNKVDHHLNKFESTLPVDASLQFTAYLLPFSEKKIFEKYQHNSKWFSLYKGTWPFIWANLKSFSKGALCQDWLKLTLWFCRRGKCIKFTTTPTKMTHTTNKVYQKGHLSLWLSWAKNGLCDHVTTFFLG